MEDCSLEKFASQLKREDLLVESVEIWPQFICDWFIDGLSFVAPHWQHHRMRWLSLFRKEPSPDYLSKIVQNKRLQKKWNRARHPDTIRKQKRRYRERYCDKICRVRKTVPAKKPGENTPAASSSLSKVSRAPSKGSWHGKGFFDKTMQDLLKMTREAKTKKRNPV